jgi:hypothetical protein
LEKHDDKVLHISEVVVSEMQTIVELSLPQEHRKSFQV